MHPDSEALAKQYGKRLFFDRRLGGGPDNRLYELKSMLQFLKVSKIAQYFSNRFTGKVPRLYRECFSFIERVFQLAAANNSSLSCYCFVVEPYLKGTSEKAFRILSSPRGEASSSVSHKAVDKGLLANRRVTDGTVPIRGIENELETCAWFNF